MQLHPMQLGDSLRLWLRLALIALLVGATVALAVLLGLGTGRAAA